MAKIELRGVSKSFDGFMALDDLNMNVTKGAVYGLVGPNGAGKTTAIRHLAGVLRPDRGEVLVDGESVYENTDIKGRMVCVPDDVFYFLPASTRDMMKFWRGVYPHFDEKRYNALGDAFSVDEKQSIRRLSRGMQKQATIRLALSARPELLVLDEPMDGLDPVMRRQVWSLILSDVAEYGMTVLVSSHNLRELEDVCDHVGILNRGKCLLERSLSQLQDNVSKVLIALPDEVALPEGLQLLHESRMGKLRTLILRGSADELTATLSVLNPMYMDVVPLTLEEIFIYELGGADYAVKDILL